MSCEYLNLLVEFSEHGDDSRLVSGLVCSAGSCRAARAEGCVEFVGELDVLLEDLHDWRDVFDHLAQVALR